MKAIITIIMMTVLASGCANTDPNTIWLISKRLSDIESGSQGQSRSPQARTDLNYITLYVPIGNGGYYPVKITQLAATCFQGPKGEVYYSVPTIDQLRKIYAPSTQP
jgi:hypothetical protein